MLPASLAAAAAFPMFLQGVLHMPSLPVLAMLFVSMPWISFDVLLLTISKPIIYASESLGLFICCSPSRSQKCLPWEVVLAALSCSVVLYNEYRLMVPGITWGVTSMLLMGLSRSCFIIASERSGSDLALQSRLKAYYGFATMSLTFGTIFSGIFALQFEDVESLYPLSRDTIALSVLNVLSFIGSAFTGTWVLAYSPISFEEGKEHFSNVPIRPLNFLASSVASVLVILCTILSDRPPHVSWIQILAYLVGTTSLLGAEQIHETFLLCMGNTQQRLNQSLQKEAKQQRRPSGIFVAGALLILITFISWSLSSLATASINYIGKGSPPSLDDSYKPESRFDIVVSMYEEDPGSVKKMLDEIKATTPLQSLKSRVIIYTKNSNENLYHLKLSTGADIVERLENLGREGGTYLWHIVNKWDELAKQTMFIQAHAHNMRELIPRIESYLVTETGMLSLGFTGITCACDTCGDRFGWEDKWDVVPTLYERIYSKRCTSSTPPILLSYKGQFVASAQRIRGIERRNYGGLLRTITSVDGWSHNQTVIGHGEGGVTGADSPSNPHFGFTVERVWSLLMQCATNPVVTNKCPSLLSGMGVGGSVADCQCLDS